MKSTLVVQPKPATLTRGTKTRPSEAPATAPRSPSVVLFGTSFKTSSLSFREALASRIDEYSSELPSMLASSEYAQLVTCNRIEILIATDSPRGSIRAFEEWVSETSGLQPGSVYVHEGVGAIDHLFRVASGLDSMVLGEEQILSQVKKSGVTARTSGSSRASLSALFDASVSVGRRARSALGLADASVSSMALRFALERLPRPPRGVLLIGTGKTARLAASLVRGAKLYFVTRRSEVPSFSRAVVLSRVDIKRVAPRCDLIISATKHNGYVLRKGDLDGRRRVVLDLAFPRNVDPGLNSGSTEVYNLDDLARIFSSRSPQAGLDSVRAEAIVSEEARRFARWLLASRQSPTLAQVYRWAEGTRKEEADAALRRLPNLSARERKVVEAMSRRLVSKLLSPPTLFARSSSPELPQKERLELVQRIFDQGG